MSINRKIRFGVYYLHRLLLTRVVFSIRNYSFINQSKTKNIEVYFKLFLKYENSTTTIEVPYSNIKNVLKNFNKFHKYRFGVLFKSAKIFIDYIETEVVIKNSNLNKVKYPKKFKTYTGKLTYKKIFTGNAWKLSLIHI